MTAKECIKRIVGIVCFLIIVLGIGSAIWHSPCPLQSEYTTRISVETPDKIGGAVSNAVASLEKKDFVPVNLEVKWHPASKTYVIYARGIDRTKLSKYEP